MIRGLGGEEQGVRFPGHGLGRSFAAIVASVTVSGAQCDID